MTTRDEIDKMYKDKQVMVRANTANNAEFKNTLLALLAIEYLEVIA